MDTKEPVGPGSHGHHLNRAGLGEHFTPDLPSDFKWIPPPFFGFMYEVKAGVDWGWKIAFTFWAKLAGLIEAAQSPVLKRL